MKKNLLLLVFVLAITQVFAQSEKKSSTAMEDRNFRIPLIGEKAPEFTAESTNGTINFPSDFGRKWKILFSHPQDFTPVCSTEILELARLQGEFDKMGVKIAVISTDPVSLHKQWIKSLEELSVKDKDVVQIKFPLIGDDHVVVAKKYGMIHAETNSTKSVRGVFVIDPDNVIEAIYFYPINIGRNTAELIRTVEALQTSAQLSTKSSHVMTPVNWTPGQDLLVNIPPKAEETKTSGVVPDGYYSPVWYMWYKKAN